MYIHCDQFKFNMFGGYKNDFRISSHEIILHTSLPRPILIKYETDVSYNNW